jgi:hypothetical protein
MSKTLQTRFKLRAVRAFPNEYVAFLIGRRAAKDHLEVTDMYFPDNQAAHVDDYQATIPNEWWIKAMEYAAEKKLIVLGNCHSHTYPWLKFQGACFEPVQSIEDLKSWEVIDLITGIANVVENGAGKKHCSDLNFYGPPNDCEVKVK